MRLTGIRAGFVWIEHGGDGRRRGEASYGSGGAFESFAEHKVAMEGGVVLGRTSG